MIVMMMFIKYNADCEGGPEEERLLNDLFTDNQYRQLARPVANDNDTLEVLFGLSLQQIVDVVRIISRFIKYL